MPRLRNARWLSALLTALLATSATPSRADETNIAAEVQLLRQQNEVLQSQLHQQREMIESLNSAVSELKQANAQRDTEAAQPKTEPENSPMSGNGFNFGKVNISGEGGVGFFETGRNGNSSHNEFRVDEAKLFVDAAVWNNVYAFAEINFATREQPDVNLRLGELYLDIEDISELWGREGQVNLRAGRLDIPFGEEYLERDGIDNPLISHSLADFWGVDEGVELYGSLGKFSYVVAAQNGGIPDTRDYDSDKSVAGRISYDPTRWLHLSVSGMRTGDLNVKHDQLSAMWFGNGFFRSLGASNSIFHANIAQGDVRFRLPHGHIAISGGYLRYDDNDQITNNGRDVYFYSVEGVHDITRRFYAGARFSQIFARRGFPIVGNGEMGTYLFDPLTEEIWRLSLGLGYRPNKHLLVKTEYTLEQGKEFGGDNRNHSDLFAAEAAFGF